MTKIRKIQLTIEDEPLVYHSGETETIERYTIRMEVDGKILSYAQLYPEIMGPQEDKLNWFLRKAGAAVNEALHEKDSVAAATDAR
jgi:hypothetical protein